MLKMKLMNYLSISSRLVSC